MGWASNVVPHPRGENSTPYVVVGGGGPPVHILGKLSGYET